MSRDTPEPGRQGDTDRAGEAAAEPREAQTQGRALRAETALRQAEERFARFMANLPGLAWIKDSEGRYIFANEAAARAFGRRTGEIYGRFDEDLFSPDTAAKFRAHDRRVLAEGHAVEVVETLEYVDGVHHSLVSKFPIPANDGSGSVWVGGIAIDLTEERRQADELRASGQRHRQLIEALPAAIYATDAEGRIQFYNDAAERLWGRRPDLGRERWSGAYRLFASDGAEVPLDRSPMAMALLEQRPVEGEEMIIERPDGSRRWVQPHPVPLHDAGGRLLGAVNMLFDVTERKRAEAALRESEERFRNLADSAPVPIWLNDADGCQFVNREYLAFFGCTMEQVRAGQWAKRLHPDDAGPYLTAYERAFAAGLPFEMQVRCCRQDGEYRWLRSTGVPRLGADGRVIGYVGCSVDITEIKRTEEALREVDRRKDEFLAVLAHELRNPLAPIRNAVEILRVAGNDAAALAEVRGLLDRQLAQMVRLVDDLLDVSRISRGKIELRRQRVELTRVLADAIETARPSMATGGHRLELDLGRSALEVDADATRLAQVFANLLNNAAKYTPSGGEIRVSLAPEEGWARVSVRDNGIGIPGDMIGRVFDPFTQVERAGGSAEGGLGIGLSIARQLIEMHGGRIEAHSDGEGRGSEFVVWLPIVASRLAAPAEGGPPPARAAVTVQRRILIADDNLDAANSLAYLLRLIGNEVVVAGNGSEALRLAESFAPEVAFLDIGMPELDGYEVCRRLRQRAGGGDTLLVALTGWGQEEDRRRSRAAGFDHHLVKPIDHDLVVDLLARARPA